MKENFPNLAKEINIQLEENKETRIQKKKNEERLRNLWDNFK